MGWSTRRGNPFGPSGTLRFRVEEQDIVGSSQCHSRKCAVARALLRFMGRRVLVDVRPDEVSVFGLDKALSANGTHATAKPSWDTEQWISRYDDSPDFADCKPFLAEITLRPGEPKKRA